MPTATILAWLINGCYIYMKTWSQSCHSFHAVNALESPKLSKRTTPKAPRLCTYIGSSLDQRTTESSEANKGCIQYTSWGVPVALFLTTFARTARFLHCQNQSVQLRLICIYVCPTSAHRGFRYRYGYRRYKGNTFIKGNKIFRCNSLKIR